MNWSDERYVRLYTRDTTDWLLFPWQARALFPLILRKVDRSGVINVGRHGVAGLAEMVRLPFEVVDTGITALLADGCIVATDEAYIVRNFIEAQEAAQSDKARAREHRERKRTEALEVTKRDATSRNVTDESRNVTENHGASHAVTPSHTASLLAVPCRAVPIQTNLPRVTAQRRESFDLDALYAAYPRHEGKADGMKRLKSLITTEDEYETHRKAIENLKARVARDKVETRFIPLFSTWVNGRWEDYRDGIPVPPAKPTNGTAPVRPQPVYSTPESQAARREAEYREADECRARDAARKAAT